MTNEFTFVRRDWVRISLQLVGPNLLLLGYSVVVLFLPPFLVSGADSPRLPRTNLMVYKAPDGSEASVEFQSDWEKRRPDILKGMEKVMGSLPDRRTVCPLDVRTETETNFGSCVCRFITYASEPGSRVPAYLLIPKALLSGDKKAWGILALHPTEMKEGHRVVIEQVRDYYPPYARELAERGFVVLAPAYPLMANYQPDLKTLGYQSGTMKAIWDNMRGLDLLESLPFIRKGSFGAIGHSLGGHNSIFTAVFDVRIKVIVSSCGFDSFVDYMNGNIKGWTSERYMPRLAEYATHVQDVPFDFPELIGALAPRSIFISAPLHDGNFKFSSVDEIVKAARPIFQLYGASNRLIVEHFNCAHEFPGPVRERAYAFIETTLH